MQEAILQDQHSENVICADFQKLRQENSLTSKTPVAQQSIEPEASESKPRISKGGVLAKPEAAPEALFVSEKSSNRKTFSQSTKPREIQSQSSARGEKTNSFSREDGQSRLGKRGVSREPIQLPPKEEELAEGPAGGSPTEAPKEQRGGRCRASLRYCTIAEGVSPEAYGQPRRHRLQPSSPSGPAVCQTSSNCSLEPEYIAKTTLMPSMIDRKIQYELEKLRPLYEKDSIRAQHIGNTVDLEDSFDVSHPHEGLQGYYFVPPGDEATVPHTGYSRHALGWVPFSEGVPDITLRVEAEAPTGPEFFSDLCNVWPDLVVR